MPVHRLAMASGQIRRDYVTTETRDGYPGRDSYQTSHDRDLVVKQRKFPTLTPAVYVEKKEVETYDGYKLIEPLLDKDHKPHELHLIKKIANMEGEPKWVKRAMKKLGFEVTPRSEWKVVYNVKPNTPEINELLWLCKHLVRITAVNFKNGHPNEHDLGNTRLNLETGEFEIIKKLDCFTVDHMYDCQKVNGVPVTSDIKPADSFGLTKDDLVRDLHRQKQLCRLNDEYFPAVYDYKYDQDKPGVVKIKGRANTDISQDSPTDDM